MTVALRTCHCPLPSSMPNKPWLCVKCQDRLGVVSNDETVAEFFDRLQSALPVVDDVWRLFRFDCEEREKAGRPRFGYRYLQRNNLRDAREEAADLALYAMLDSLKERRAHGHDDDEALVFQIALYAFKAYEASFMLRERRHGAP